MECQNEPLLDLNNGMTQLPPLESDGMSSGGKDNSMEVNEAQYHVHLSLESSVGRTDYSKRQKLHCQSEAVQMS